jgi:hypothetical protein
LFDGQSHEARCKPSFRTGAGVSPFIHAEHTLSAKFRSSAADRRSAFILPGRFWFFLRHQKEQKIRNNQKNIKQLNSKSHDRSTK